MTVKYFHGGPRGLREILPPCATGAPSCASYGAGNVCRRDRVYLTTVYEAALIYAGMHPSGNGVVYEVAPVGDVWPDPDYLGKAGESVEAASARVIRKFRIDGKTLRRIRNDILADPLLRKGVQRSGLVPSVEEV